MTINAALFSSDRMDWETPQELFDALNDEFKFTLDAASSHENAKCERHYTESDNALSKSWAGETVFCNPPYGRGLKDWVKKGYEEGCKPGTVVVMLIPARTDTKYFHGYIHNRAEVRFIPGRLKFCVGGGSERSGPVPLNGCRMARGAES